LNENKIDTDINIILEIIYLSSFIMASATASPIMKRTTKMIRPRGKKIHTMGEGVSEKMNDINNGNNTTVLLLPPIPATSSHSPSHSPSPEKILQENSIIKPYCDPDLFVQRQVKRTITVPFYKITKNTNIEQLLRSELAKSVEGQCSIEGYICPNSISICSHSGGTLSAANILFDVTANCLICFPDENVTIKCVAKTITQAGIRAGARYLEQGHVSPIEVFLSRDMHLSSRELFSRIEEGDILTVNIIGRRFVLHDTHITIIAMLMDAEKNINK